MKTYGHILTQLALAGALVLPGQADTIDWAPLQRTLAKPNFDSNAAVHQVTSAEGNEVTFKLRHLGTTPERFTYSKWEIDHWGDPSGIFADLGRVTVEWAPNQGDLEKPGYNQASDCIITTASNGTTQVTFDLNHVVTTEDKFGYSKWEINS